MVVKAFETITLARVDDGSDGAPGKAGVDGKTPYFHQAWADSKDGKINFSATDPTNRGYLGTYSDFTQADSTDPTKYLWVELVGAIEIGGRNLVSGTNQEYAMGYGIPTTSWKDGYAYLKLPANVMRDEILPQGPHTFWYTLAQGVVYTQTIWFETDATVKDLSAVQITWYTSAGHDYQPARVQKLGQNSYKIVSTYTWPGKSDNNVRLFDIEALNSSFDLSTGTYLKFGKLKLEIGNKATDWSPAPEDTQGQIDKINNGLSDVNKQIEKTPFPTVSPTAPINPKTGDQWWVKDSDGNINAFKTWDGTKWSNLPIDQSMLIIKTLNSVTVNSAIINSPNINVPFNDLSIPGFMDKLSGVMAMKDANYSIDGKLGDSGAVFHTGLTPDGWESYRTTVDGNTKLAYARTSFGQLQLWTWLSGSGANANYVRGTLDGQNTYRNTGIPAYLNNWGIWNQATQVRITRNGRQVTISGYIKHYGGTVSPIIQVPAWAYPANPTEIISGASFDEGVGNSKACNLSMSAYGTLSNNAGVQVNGYLSFSSSYTGVDIS